MSTNLNNRNFRYSHDSGTTWTMLTLPEGSFDYKKLNDTIKSILESGRHSSTGIALTFKNQLFRVKITLEATYRVDFTKGSFATLIGFDKVIVTQTGVGQRVLNISMSYDNVCIHCNIISGMVCNGRIQDIM